MITNRVLGTVLLGINEQISCNDCVSAFGSAGSFSAGVHGRKNITDNLALLAGIAYTHYSEGGYSVTSAPIGAIALRYDFTDWGSSRPFFDIGTLLTPYEKVSYRRNYVTSLGAVAVDGNTTADTIPRSTAARAGSQEYRRATVARRRRGLAALARVKGWTSRSRSIRSTPLSAGTDKTTLAKIGGQWTHPDHQQHRRQYQRRLRLCLPARNPASSPP
jgi:hypothetical protein